MNPIHTGLLPFSRGQIKIYSDYTASMARNRNGETKRQGIELSARIDLNNGLTLGSSYKYLDATTQDQLNGVR